MAMLEPATDSSIAAGRALELHVGGVQNRGMRVQDNHASPSQSVSMGAIKSPIDSSALLQELQQR